MRSVRRLLRHRHSRRTVSSRDQIWRATHAERNERARSRGVRHWPPSCVKSSHSRSRIGAVQGHLFHQAAGWLASHHRRQT